MTDTNKRELDWKYILLIVIIIVNGILAFTNHRQITTDVNSLTNDVSAINAEQANCGVAQVK